MSSASNGPTPKTWTMSPWEKTTVLTGSGLHFSGGFARVMSESLARPETEFVQLMDDDVRLEPDTVLRVRALADVD